jgi:hypothetical protein
MHKSRVRPPEPHYTEGWVGYTASGHSATEKNPVTSRNNIVHVAITVMYNSVLYQGLEF